VVGQICDELAVMYAGRIVETGPAEAVLSAPRHPYTAALLASAIDVDSIGVDSTGVDSTGADSTGADGSGERRLPRAIPGAVPDPLRLPPGCPFQPRCPFAQPDCAEGPVPLRDVGPGRRAACLHHEQLAAGHG
jgi:ABC-type dipeptide/oligopeptide/nickel transport system ATPase component